MEKLQVISHPQFGNLSFISIDGREMFKAKECAIMLGYKDTVNAIKQHCKGVVKHHLPTTSGKQTVNLIPEGDLWRLIIRSKLPQAEQIEKWIMEEVLPSIRKTGTYSTEQTYEQLRLEDKPYEYVDKFYKGKPVLTSVDFQHFSGISHTNIDHVLRKICTEHIDYELLKGADLAAFKKENPKFTRLVSSIFVIFKSGFDKLSEYFKVTAEIPKIMIEEKNSNLMIEDKKKGSPIYNPSIDECITALNVLKYIKSASNNINTVNSIDTAINFCAIALSVKTSANFCKS